MTQWDAPGDHEFTGVLNVPGIHVAKDAPQDFGLNTPEPEAETELEPGSSEDNPRDATTIELEYVKTLRAQRIAAAGQETMFYAAQVAIDRLSELLEDNLERNAEVSPEEIRRRHAMHCATQIYAESGVNTQIIIETAKRLAHWLNPDNDEKEQSS